MKIAMTMVVILLLATAVQGQTPTPAPPTEPIEITASAVSLPGFSGQTLAGTLAGTQFNITPYTGVENVNFMTSGAQTNAFLAGYSDGHLGGVLSKKLNNTSPWLNGYDFQLRLHADFGIARITDPTGSLKQGFAGLWGGQLKYAIKGSSTWSLAVRVDDLFTKALPRHNNLVIALGPTINFKFPGQ